MAKLRKPSMEVYLFGDRDVIATSTLPDYSFSGDPSGIPESPELPMGSMMTTMQGRSAASSQDLFGMMQNMMLANGLDQNQDRMNSN